jgi:hypothetical protein
MFRRLHSLFNPQLSARSEIAPLELANGPVQAFVMFLKAKN